MELKKSLCIPLFTIAVLLMMTGIGQTGIDPVQLELLGGDRIPLSWKNIDGPPELISDVSYDDDDVHGYRLITFHPGQEVFFHLPAYSMIRLYNPGGEVAEVSFSISISDGNGLFIDQPIIHGSDRTSIFVAPSMFKPQMARVTLSEDVPSPVSVALFTSYYESVGRPLAYLKAMKLTAPEAELRRRPLEAGQTYYLMEAERPTQVRVSGPSHYSLEQRMIYQAKLENRRVEYTVNGILNRERFLSVSVTTEPDSRELIDVDGSYPLLSRKEHSYFFIPEGEHVLTLVPTQSLYVRLLKKESSNFLFPKYNDPLASPDRNSITVEQVREKLFPLKNHPRRHPNLHSDSIETYARLLWTDNRHAEGGLASAMAMTRLAELYPGLADVQRYTRRTKGAHTFFRDIVPQSGSGPILQRFFTFISPALKSLDHENLVFHPKTETLPGTDERQTSLFTALESTDPARPSTSQLLFELPERRIPSELRLRVIIDQQPQTFGIQVGTEPEIICQLRPETIRPVNEFRVTGYEASRLSTEGTAPTMMQPKYAELLPETRRAASISIPLRHPAERVVVRRIDHTAQPVYISVQYRDSRPFELTEHQYLELLKDSGADDISFTLFGDMLKGYFHKSAIKYRTRSEYELASFFRPLVRLVKILATEYTSSVYPLSERFSDTAVPTDETIRQVQNYLQNAVAQHQWVSVVEHSSFLFQSTTGITQQEAAKQMINALLMTGEGYLAELHLKGMLIHSSEDQTHLAEWAKLRLERLYREKNDLQRLASLFAVGLAGKLTVTDCNKFTEILLKQGKQRLALRAALIPRVEDRKTELVLQATLANRWWNVFHQSLETVSEQEISERWRGLEKLAGNDTLGARQLFTEQKTDQLRQETLTGPLAWNNEPHHIYQHGGGALLYSEAQDLHMQMYRSEPDHPVRFRLRGPVTITTTIRPLHHAERSSPINGWARLQSDQELDLIPISNNLPNQQWRLVRDKRYTPGMVTEFKRTFGPGLHDMSLSSDAVSLLVSLKVQRPVVMRPGLAPLNAELIDAASKANRVPYRIKESGRISCLMTDCVTLLPELPTDKPRFFLAENLHPYLNQRNLESAATQSPPALNDVRSDNSIAVDPVTTVARLMAQNRWQDALEHAAMNTPEERAQKLTLLAYLSKTKPQERIEYEVQARSLLHRFPDTKNGSSLLRRISANSRWKQVPFVQGSAGLRLLPYQSWRPEEPSMRIRKALLRQQPNGQTVLTGSDSTILMMENSERSHLSLTFTLAELPYLKPESIRVAYQLDDNQPDLVKLSPDTPKTVVSITVPSGHHRLSVAILERFTNQYLWVNFTEDQKDTGHRLVSKTIWSAQNQERAFHVVSPEEPLVATIAGPAWVRVDELTNGTISSAYYHITAAVQNLIVRSDGPKGERLVRIFYRVQDRSINTDSLMRTTIRTYQPVLPPLLPADLVPVPGNHQVLAALSPPLPEIDSSRSATLSYHRRRDLQEDSISDEPEVFAQLTAEFQKFYEPLDAYLQSSVFIRRRENGGPTVGIIGDYTWKNPQLPLTLRVQGEVLTQNPNGSSLELFDWDPVEWSARLRVSAYQYRQISLKLTHRPKISVFGRLLSTDTSDQYEPGSLDQDIYTPYKADHKLGLQLSEYLSYRPWLDSQFNARAVFALNENFNLFEPDHLRLAIGWRQLLASFQVSAAYQFTRFFEDEDRLDIIDRNDLSLALFWDPLFNADNWLRFHFRYRFQLETGEHTGMIGLTWYFDGNRALFHQRPEDDPFSSLRRIRTTMKNYNRDSK